MTKFSWTLTGISFAILFYCLRLELHHFGWNACVSCPDRESAHKYLIVPGFFSGNIHIVDVTSDPLNPKIIHVKVKFHLSLPI